MYRVLSTSRNTSLLISRNDVLAMAGFSVISPRSPEQAPSLAAQQSVDAVVIGHSVEPPLRKEIIAAVREAIPECVICFAYAAPDTEGEPLADVSLDVTHGAEPLVLALQQRLPRTTAKVS
jgi:hypothetical protein